MQKHAKNAIKTVFFCVNNYLNFIYENSELFINEK